MLLDPCVVASHSSPVRPPAIHPEEYTIRGSASSTKMSEDDRSGQGKDEVIKVHSFND